MYGGVDISPVQVLPHPCAAHEDQHEHFHRVMDPFQSRTRKIRRSDYITRVLMLCAMCVQRWPRKLSEEPLLCQHVSLVRTEAGPLTLRQRYLQRPSFRMVGSLILDVKVIHRVHACKDKGLNDILEPLHTLPKWPFHNYITSFE